jgi:ABC-type polysaccharide/polyol phosphate transport system ATPase subunit
MDAIVVERATKTYRMGIGRGRIREMTPPPFDRLFRRLFPNWWLRDTFNALEDVSITVPPGGSVGLVGPNGAGKTTLLKVISGVTATNEGRVTVSGRIGALIDVLVGFHPELTGEENAYLFGAIHGLSRRQIADRLDRILEFAEIGDLSKTPVKRYSAGMQARLGFATLVAIEPEILLVDEVLAVGDAAFQRKCTRWLDGYRQGGGTLMFVSHNLALVRNMTNTAVWLDHGRVIQEDATEKVLGEYARAMERRDTDTMDRSSRRRGAQWRAMVDRGLYRWGAGGARVEEFHLDESSAGEAGLEFTISYESKELERAVFCVGFVNESGQEIGAAASPEVNVTKRGVITCAIRPAPFRSGIYFPVAAILSTDGQVHDRWRLERAIVVDRNGEVGSAQDFGPVEIRATWSPR